MNAIFTVLILFAAALFAGAVSAAITWTVGDRRRSAEASLTALADQVTDARGRAL